MVTPIIGVGAGGHAKVVIEILRLAGAYEIVGLLDTNSSRWGTEVLGVRVLGDDSRLSELYDQGIHTAFIGLGTTKSSQQRTKLYGQVRNAGFEIAASIHPQALISSSAKIGHGPTIMAAAVINSSAVLGDNVIVNTGAIVEHDCVVANHVHVATGACLAGAVRVGEGTFIGSGAIVKHGISIGGNVVVGAGAVVVNDVPDNVVVIGVPARVTT